MSIINMKKSKKPAQYCKNTTKKAKQTKKNRMTTANGQGVVKSESTESSTMSISGGTSYKEMNHILILGVSEIFETDAFRENLKIGNFDRVKAIYLIHESTFAHAQRIVRRISKKVNARSKNVEGPTINGEDDKVLSEMGTKKCRRRSVPRLPWKRTNFVTDVLSRPSN